MDVYTYYTPSHAVFFQRYLCPSASRRFDLLPLHGIDRCGAEAHFGKSGWAETCIEKMQLFREAIEDRTDEVVVFSDPDVIFAHVTPDDILRELDAAEIAGQRAMKGSDTICAGFFALRVSGRTLAWLDRVLELAPECDNVHDQEALNRLRHQVNYKALPNRYWHWQLETGMPWSGAMSKLRPPPKDVAVVHATWVNGRSRKLRFMDWMWQYCQPVQIQ